MALTIKPDGMDAHFGLGSLYIETGQVRKAAFHLERIMTIDPTSELGSRMIAQAYSIQRTYAFAAPKPDK